MILLFSQRIIFRSPELHILEKKGLTVVQKLQVLAPPEQNSKKIIVHGFLFQFRAIYRKHMLYSQYTKQHNVKTGGKFRQQRTLVTKGI
jgi:hypothetical protein